MFSLWVLALLPSLLLSGVLAAPTCELKLAERSAVEKRAVPSSPRFVIYSDKWVSGETGPPKASTIKV